MSGAAPTTTIETVTVTRPLKVIALLALILAVLALVVCLLTTFWIRSGDFYTGLFAECTSDSANARPWPRAPAPGTCQGGDAQRFYTKIVAALLILAALVCIAAVALTVLGLSSDRHTRKYIFYRIAMYFSLLAVLLDVIALVLFPICFYLEIKDWGIAEWTFDWSYGVAWGSTLLTFGAALLLICDKEHEEIYYKEKTIYNQAPTADL